MQRQNILCQASRTLGASCGTYRCILKYLTSLSQTRMVQTMPCLTWSVCHLSEGRACSASQQNTAHQTATTPTPAAPGSTTKPSQMKAVKYVVMSDIVCVRPGAEAQHAVASQQDTARKTAAAPTPVGSGSPTKQQSGSPTKHGSGSTFGGLFGSGVSKVGSNPLTGGSVSSWLPSWGGGKKETEQVTRQAHEAACAFARHAALTCVTLLWMHSVQGPSRHEI